VADSDFTKRHKRVATLVFVGNRAEHVEACRRCADQLKVVCQTCAIDGAATKVARWRPVGGLVDETVYEFDPRELKALARDVRAKLNTLPADHDARRLQRDQMPALERAYRERYSRDETPSD
jgi:hypothetical protein